MESLSHTLVDEQRDATPPYGNGPPHDDGQPMIQCVQRTQASPVLPRRPSQKSLPQIYRPPTPPLPAEYPKLRPAAHAGTSAESVAYTLHSGLMSADSRLKAAPSQHMCAEKARRAARHTDTQEARRRCGPAASGHEIPEKPLRPAGGPPCSYRASAMSASTAGNRSSSGRSYCPGDVCFSVWYVLKGWGVHVRAKIGHAGRY
ncbi:uncharacterized protein TRAVEDRAFT_27412 [Trametes versicolor FP-101664 SS1]|uniref:uncharacterized protein n=1 Tax=Trametes versicolor (strain FP-101664) TaxID=717944 RepID=UPI0004621EE7|nr:uncharacterized protein TRAVEDRAFT_27412 [Trametes versicolor FP-101664 SS1]EIW61997.1 hypothetical protein TRAVEDRAFT_27412 [Trametes versicolor FP-101664 SS1]